MLFRSQGKDAVMTIRALVVWVDGSASYQQLPQNRTILEMEQLLEGYVDTIDVGNEATAFYSTAAKSKGMQPNEVANEIAGELGCDIGEEGFYGNVIFTGRDDGFGRQTSVPESLAEDIINISEMRCV